MAQRYADSQQDFIHHSGDDDMDDDDFESDVEFRLLDTSEDDYYVFLNLPRNATPEEITNQYRKLSKIYHPDKHSSNPQKKTYAENLFAKTKKAYEVLSDPHKRAIYDSVGIKGLETEGWELVQRYKTPLEIREEYERLARQKEERDLEKRTNPKGSVTVNINATEIFSGLEHDSYDDEDYYYYDVGPYIELTGFNFNQSVEAPITANNTLLLSGNVAAENGRGRGQICAGFKRAISNKTWGEVEVGGSTNGLEFGFKGYSQFSKRYFTNLALACNSMPDGLNLGTVAGLGTQFDSNSLGTLTWRSGGLSGLQTSYIYETAYNRFVASAQIGVPHSFGSLSIIHKKENNKYRSAFKAGTFGAFFEYGIEHKISSITTFGATMIVGAPLGVSLRLKVSRANQVYNFPIHLCDQIVPAPIFYGTVTPCLVWLVISKLFIEPQERQKKREEKEKLKAAYEAKMEEKKREAQAAVELMKETYNRIVRDEEKVNGLVICSAKYGIITAQADVDNANETTTQLEEQIIDVTIPLQCLVKDQKLMLHDMSKSQLPGFYDPSPAEAKQLLINYIYKEERYRVVLKDEEPVMLPKKSHKINI